MKPSFHSIGTLSEADISLLTHASFVDPYEVLLVDSAILPKRLNISQSQVSDLLLRISGGCFGKLGQSDSTVLRSVLSTGDEEIDRLLEGGIHTGVLTEVTGESASGKTQLMLQLSTMVQLPHKCGGLAGGVAYLSSEGNLQTGRLGEIASALRLKFDIGDDLDARDNIHFLACNDSEALEHALAYALPPLIERCRNAPQISGKLPIRLIVLDSLTALFRGEALDSSSNRQNYMQRSSTFCTISENFKTLALAESLAVIVVNQVSDTFPPSSNAVTLDEDQRLEFGQQERFFSGQSTTLHKKPALGLVWASCVNTRLMLSRTGRRRALHSAKDPDSQGSQLIRRLSLVFSPFAGEGKLDYVVTSGGLVAIPASKSNSDETSSAVPHCREITDDLGGLGRDSAGLDLDLPEDFWNYHLSSDHEENVS